MIIKSLLQTFYDIATLVSVEPLNTCPATNDEQGKCQRRIFPKYEWLFAVKTSCWILVSRVLNSVECMERKLSNILTRSLTKLEQGGCTR